MYVKHNENPYVRFFEVRYGIALRTQRGSTVGQRWGTERAMLPGLAQCRGAEDQGYLTGLH